ncbi:MAG: DUF4097 domain-containing protein [Ruminococcus sp.]|nr:DUF4097 domain-containing protein [Ruminococcus sp.]
MNRTVKWFIAAGILIAAGIIALGVSFVVSGFDVSAFSSESEMTEREETFSAGTVSSISINADFKDVEITSSEDNNIVVSCYESERVTFSTKVSDEGKLSIEVSDSRNWYDYILPTFSFAEENTNSLIIALPDMALDSLKVETSSGNISSSKVSYSPIDNCSIYSDTGDIELSNIESGLEITSSCGNITVSDAVLSNGDGITLNTSKGDIELSGIEASCIDARTSTGNIVASDISSYDSFAIVSEHLKFNSDSGDIKLSKIKARSVEANTESGDIEGDEISPYYYTSCQEVEFSSSSGNISLESSYAVAINAHTYSGDVKLHDIDGEEFNVSTTSGNVTASLIGESYDYIFNLVTDSGDTFIDGNTQLTGDKKFNAETSSGDIDVYFSQIETTEQ